MTPSQIRLELLRQHDEIRAAIAETRGKATSVAPNLNDLRARTLRLAEQVRSHNRQEEELLQGVLSTVDTWGPLREEAMNERHVAEHQQLEGALLNASIALEVTTFHDVVLPALARVVQHMAHEEEFCLSEDILRDGATVIDQRGG